MNCRVASLIAAVVVALLLVPSIPAADLVYATDSLQTPSPGGPDMWWALIADDFTLPSPTTLTEIRFWSVDTTPKSYAGSISWFIYDNAGGFPGTLVASGNTALVDRTFLGNFGALGNAVFQNDVSIPPVSLAPGTYWLGLYNGVIGLPSGDGTFFLWGMANTVTGIRARVKQPPTSTTWTASFFGDVAFELFGTSCSAASIAVDTSLTNGLVDASVSGPACRATIAIHNTKPFWTNFSISTTGAVNVTPVGGENNLYAKYHVLPPAGVIPGLPQKSVSFTALYTQPGESVRILLDPTAESGMTAGVLNTLQAVLNVLPLGGTPLLVVDDYQKIAEALPELPHLQSATVALFQQRPDPIEAAKQLIGLFSSTSERHRLESLTRDLGYNITFDTIKVLASYPWRIVNSLATVFGQVRSAVFNYPAGSVGFVAQ